MKPETEKMIKEAIIIGMVIGVLSFILINVFLKNDCLCYDEYDYKYATRMFDFPKKECAEQCVYFGEREGIPMTDVEPEEKERGFGISNWSLDVRPTGAWR